MRGPLPAPRPFVPHAPLRVPGALGTEAVSPFYAAPERPVCAWDDCEKPGREEVHRIEADGTRGVNVWWFFCSELHRSYHDHSHREMGRVAPGEPFRPRFV